MVSTRFSWLSRKSLWQDCVALNIKVNQADPVTDRFLHDGIREICLEGLCWMDDMNHTISGDNIASIALKCPNLKRLEICKAKIDTWPTVCMPSLEVLSINSPQCGSDMFRNMQLHLLLPELKILHILRPSQMWLPDMTQSPQLCEVMLDGGKFLPQDPQKYQEGTVPFPRSLKKLSCWAKAHNFTKEEIREYYENSDCVLLL